MLNVRLVFFWWCPYMSELSWRVSLALWCLLQLSSFSIIVIFFDNICPTYCDTLFWFIENKSQYFSCAKIIFFYFIGTHSWHFWIFIQVVIPWKNFTVVASFMLYYEFPQHSLIIVYSVKFYLLITDNKCLIFVIPCIIQLQS